MIEWILMVVVLVAALAWPLRAANPCRPWCPVFENPSYFGFDDIDACRKQCGAYKRYRKGGRS